MENEKRGVGFQARRPNTNRALMEHCVIKSHLPGKNHVTHRRSAALDAVVTCASSVGLADCQNPKPVALDPYPANGLSRNHISLLI